MIFQHMEIVTSARQPRTTSSFSTLARSRRELVAFMAKAKGVKYVPGMRYCMFIASSRILSPLKQIAAALNKIALTNDQPTPTQATTYDQSYEISELSFRT